MKTRKIAYLFLAVIGLNSQATSEGWSTISIQGTALENSSVQILGKNGVTARCNPEGIDLIPSFSSSSTSHLCAGAPRINSGSRTKILEVYKKGSVYAAKVEVTHASRPDEKGSAQKGKVQWVEFNPESAFMQIYDERTGAVHPLEKYLDAAAAGEKIEMPAFEEPEDVDAVVQEQLDHATPGDDPGATPSVPEVVASLEEIPDQTEFQSAPPGAHVEAPGPIHEPEVQPLPANSSYCEMPVEAQRVDDRACLSKPPQSINGNWRNCPEAVAKDVAHQGDASYRGWLIDLVNDASQEVSQAPRGSGSTCASPALMMSLMDQESTFNPMTSNAGGDHGIAQFQLGTASDTIRFLGRVASPNSPMHNTISKTGGLLWAPSECKKTGRPLQDTLTPECQRALQSQCIENGKLVASLFCPQFAVRLQAYHIKQICEEEVEMNGVNVTQVLQGNGDPIAQARFVVSRYNRGMRIYNSAAHYHAQYGTYPTAHEYGELWDVRRPTAFANRNSDPYAGGNLLGQTINRCYNWRVTGLCGGIQDTIFSHYLRTTCASQPQTPAASTASTASTGSTGSTGSTSGVTND